MSDATFDADWLRLREPVDHRSRSRELEERLRVAGEAEGWRRVVDLGGGAGSNVRHLSRRLPWATSWRVVDHDPALLARIAPPPGCEVECVQADLATKGLASIADADVVTASALLDLVSDGWLTDLARRCARADCGVLLALTVDGSVDWHGPADPDDDWIRDAFRRHQERDKGLGTALGPRAAPAARDALDRAGFDTWMLPSPWILSGADDEALARDWLGGFASAAAEIEPERRAEITAWADRRARALARGDHRLEVGHLDVLALPRRVTRSTRSPQAMPLPLPTRPTHPTP